MDSRHAKPLKSGRIMIHFIQNKIMYDMKTLILRYDQGKERVSFFDLKVFRILRKGFKVIR
jgi:hypothetical protein